MDTLGNVFAAVSGAIVAGGLVWRAVKEVRDRRAARWYAAQLEARLPSEPTGLDLDLVRLRCAVAELRHDVERWERGERS